MAEEADSAEEDSETDIPEEIRMRKDRLAKLQHAIDAIKEQARQRQERKDNAHGDKPGTPARSRQQVIHTSRCCR